jgi:molecular chaperone DnaK
VLLIFSHYKSIGYIEITGKSLKRDISKGSDIEITIQLSESQELTVSAYLTMADQEFKETFNPKERHTPIGLLREQIVELSSKLDTEIGEATKREEYEIAGLLTRLRRGMEETVAELAEA